MNLELMKPVDIACQKLYLGEQHLRKFNIKPGIPVRLFVRASSACQQPRPAGLTPGESTELQQKIDPQVKENLTYICRAFVNQIPQVEFGTFIPGVIEPCAESKSFLDENVDSILFSDDLLPALCSKIFKGSKNELQLDKITPLSPVQVNHLNVVLIAKRSKASSGKGPAEPWPEAVEEGLRDCLRGVFLSKGCFVHLSQSAIGQMYNIHGVLVLDATVASLKNPPNFETTCWTLSLDGKVSVRHSVSKLYLETLYKNRFAPNVAGCDAPYTKLKRSVDQRIHHILLSGPVGCGKASLVRNFAAQSRLALLSQDCGESVGESVGGLNHLISEAKLLASEVWPPENVTLKAEKELEPRGVLVLIENIESLGSRKGSHQYQGLGILQQHLESILPSDTRITVICTTSRPEEVEPSLRRPGRLGTEIYIKVPTEGERLAMLKCISEELNPSSFSGKKSANLSAIGEEIGANSLLSAEEECAAITAEPMLQKIARSTQGFLASDLSLLIRRLIATISNFEGKDPWPVIEKSIEATVPSGLKAGIGWVSLEKIDWDSIGGLEDVKAKLIRAIDWPIRKPEAFARLGIKPSKGVLLFGPPGCGKTRLVRAIASNIGATFLTVSGAELFSPYVGDSEKAVVELFRKARLGAPTVLFIDEIESLVSARDTQSGQVSQSDRILSALLTEMDGMGSRLQDSTSSGQVVVVGATNRPSGLDPALCRPGRLDTLLYIPPPDKPSRVKILETYLHKVPHEDLDLQHIADRTNNFSGADLENLVKESVLHLIAQDGMDCGNLRMQHVDQVLVNYRPSLDVKSLQQYQNPFG